MNNPVPSFFNFSDVWRCYADAEITLDVDPRCIVTAPNNNTIGEWRRQPYFFRNKVCNDDDCMVRCDENGVTYNSDYGTDYDVGDVVPCFRFGKI